MPHDPLVRQADDETLAVDWLLKPTVFERHRAIATNLERFKLRYGVRPMPHRQSRQPVTSARSRWQRTLLGIRDDLSYGLVVDSDCRVARIRLPAQWNSTPQRQNVLVCAATSLTWPTGTNVQRLLRRA
jgi:hypothetical protein